LDADQMIQELAAPAVAAGQPAPVSPSLLHWDDRNWTLALAWYLWSRQLVVPRPLAAPPSTGGRVGARGEILRLPEPRPLPAEPLGTTMFRRRAAMRLPRRSVAQDVLASVCHHGLAGARRASVQQSAAGWHESIMVFLVAYNVDGLPSGWYRCLDGRTLQAGGRLAEQELRSLMRPAMVGQPTSKGAAVTLVLILDVQRCQAMLPGESGLREAFVDAGRLAHYLILCATAHRLRAHQSPAVSDSPILELLALDRVSHYLLYTVSLS